ncbi:MAG: L,D-transpeptidase family protein [Arenicellales bacterium]
MEVVISIPEQSLELRKQGELLNCYPVSTARNGAGEKSGSECTPRGRHVIRAAIGAGCEAGSVFVGRRPTGEIWSAELAQAEPDRDWILSRILWLSGLQPGVNRLANVDTMRRYIYIHGTPCEEQIGHPVSHGCIRMRNDDLIDLYEKVGPGTIVTINS